MVITVIFEIYSRKRRRSPSVETAYVFQVKKIRPVKFTRHKFDHKTVWPNNRRNLQSPETSVVGFSKSVGNETKRRAALIPTVGKSIARWTWTDFK